MADNLSGKQIAGCITGVLGLLITTPIWYWLVYQILARVGATPTMWVFFWIYAPVGIVTAILKVAVDNLFDDKK